MPKRLMSARLIRFCFGDQIFQVVWSCPLKAKLYRMDPCLYMRNPSEEISAFAKSSQAVQDAPWLRSHAALLGIVNLGGSIDGGIQNGWSIVENPIKMDDDWGYPIFSGNHHFTNLRRVWHWKSLTRSSRHDRGEGLWPQKLRLMVLSGLLLMKNVDDVADVDDYYSQWLHRIP